jgi:phosphate transport system permease protein
MNLHSLREPIRGESMVWLTALGLGLAVTMAAGLLAVIIANGAEVFWPRRVVELQLRQDDGGVRAILAEEVKSRERVVRAGAATERHQEVQLFTGTKDVLGQAYRWVDESRIAARSQPDQALVVERLEYGDALGLPQALVLADGRRVTADDARFRDLLAAAITAADDLRGRIRTLEKERIGDNARRARDLDLRLRRHPDDHEAKAALAALRSEYQEMAAQARAMRKELEGPVLLLRVLDGSERGVEKAIQVGRIVGVWYANQAGWMARLGEACHRLWLFMAEDPREANTEGGIFPAIFGTFVMTLLMSIAVVPFGVLAAIYLREYAHQGTFVRAVRIAVNNLAGVPSIVFGVFGLGFFVYFVGDGFDELFFSANLPTPTFGTGGILWASLTLALMTVPVVIVATEEAIAAVPRGAREGSLACGASKWQTIQRIVLPASVPGILTGLILAMARGAGEVAPLMMVGVVKLAPALPLDLEWPFIHLDRKFMHLGFHIYDLGFQSPDSEAAVPMVFATTFLLILLVLILNLGAIVLRDRIRRRLTTAAF